MKILKALLSRTTFMIVAVLLELFVLLAIARWFLPYLAWTEGILRVISLIIVLLMIKNTKHLSSNLIWILLVILMPVAGTALYVFFAANLFTSKTFRAILRTTTEMRREYVQEEEVYTDLMKDAPLQKGQFHYLKEEGYPFYRNREFDYYPSGELGFPVMLEELRKAEKFIFLEYFIIEEGTLWNQILEILKEKAKQGVDVRVMYDDLGSFTTLSASYAKKLEKCGIRCVTFNRVNPLLSVIMNHRDHRKIMVIDGNVAFSGGINLADEYINTKVKYGHWKDNVIRVRGEAVWSYTLLFLTHWNALRKTDTSFGSFQGNKTFTESDGYICPYGETPLSFELVAQNVYLGILNEAREYCYIMTPYLIIDTEMINALILKARQGVDVRIVTPGIPDKRLVYAITRSYYRQLIEGGVRIFEYTPGFVHGKVFVSDDHTATVGTVNLDYRSLYLHFENGTYLSHSTKVLEIKKDLTDTMEECHEVKLEDTNHSFIKEFLLSVLRLFAPMM